MCEFAVYSELSIKYEINEPDLIEWDLGKWDDVDFTIFDKTISVKSTKYFGNLLLLEKRIGHQPEVTCQMVINIMILRF